MSNFKRNGRRYPGSISIVFSVYTCFWIIVSLCFYGVHHIDHERAGDSENDNAEILRRDTRDDIHVSPGNGVDRRDFARLLKQRRRLWAS